jgi:hypothetical protein
MFSLFSPRAELGIVFHIGTSSVGAGLVRLKRGEAPHVVYTLREAIPYQEKVEPEKFFADMIEALKRVNARLAKEGLAHLKFTEFGKLRIKHVFYVFGSPWSVTQTKVVSMTDPAGFVVTKEAVDKIVDTHEKMFEAETAGGKDFSDRLRVIEKRVVQIKLNGYEVSEPYGKKAAQADISLFISLIPKAVLDKVIDVSARTYHPKDTKVFSFPLASFSVIRDVFHSESDFIFLDIGGELSDISVVKGGLILETASFPLGRHFLIRNVKKALGCSGEEAASLIRLYEDGAIEKSAEEALKPVITRAAEEWLGALNTILSKVSTRMTLPSNLFVVINNDLVQFFMRTLRDEKVSEFGFAETPFSVTLVNHDKLRSAVEFGKNADKDPFIAMIAAFAGRVYES